MSDPYSREAVIEILKRRDGMTTDEAEELLEECSDRILRGEDPDEVLREELGLEPDYLFAILD
jgi:hypothetical protein